MENYKFEPNFSEEYKAQVLKDIMAKAVIRDRKYWKQIVDEAFADAKLRYEQDPDEYDLDEDFGNMTQFDAEYLLEGCDKNGI